jgi:hypothetical protein
MNSKLNVETPASFINLSFRPDAWFGDARALPNQAGAEESILTSESTSQTFLKAPRFSRQLTGK